MAADASPSFEVATIKPSKATTVVFDLADDDSIKRFVERSVDDLGSETLD